MGVAVSNLRIITSPEDNKKLVARWDINVQNLDGFTYTWFYDDGTFMGGDPWHTGDQQSNKALDKNYCEYTPPDDYVRVHFHILPMAKTHKVKQGNNEVDVPYWTGEVRIASHEAGTDIPDVPTNLSVSITDKNLITMKAKAADVVADGIVFEVFKVDGTKNVKYSEATAYIDKPNDTQSTREATAQMRVPNGGKYKVRAAALNDRTNHADWTSLIHYNARQNQYSRSLWTDLSSEVVSAPSGTNLKSVIALSKTSVRLTWNKDDNAEKYKIQYATKYEYLATNSNKTSSVSTTDKSTTFIVAGLEKGNQYFFRVASTNSEGDSDYSNIMSISLGSVPNAPTTWSRPTTAVVEEDCELYWSHNASDGSKETSAQVYIDVNGTAEIHTVINTDPDDVDAVTPKKYTILKTTLSVGGVIKWKVRTAGVTKEYGDWSATRQINVYQKPTIGLTVTDSSGSSIDTITGFPFYIKGVTTPSEQKPIGYSVTITSTETYTKTDSDGNQSIVMNGDSVYSKYINSSSSLLLEMNAGNIDLEPGVHYMVEVKASMDSGLMASNTASFYVSWVDEAHPIDAVVTYDENNFAAYITPFSETTDDSGNIIKTKNVTLGVYRKEIDGTMTEIAIGVSNTVRTTVTDPHPTLDYLRYRIVCTDTITGSVSYYDLPVIPVNSPYMVIQWNENWISYSGTANENAVTPPWSGSLVAIPYNVDVTDDNSPDSSLVQYAGRTYPVGYYGKSISAKSSWKCDIPWYDNETLFQLERLKIWKGNCYVRSPYGAGFWANVTVSFTRTHAKLTVPVTFTIKRVEGGV